MPKSLDFINKINKILLESISVSPSQVADAIDKKYRVLINYDDEKENAPTGVRLIEPYVFGLTLAGNEAIRAYQYYGATRRGVPKYKLFRLDRITNWDPQYNNHFYADPKKLAILAPDYNEDGDGSMSAIYNQVQFGSKKSKRESSKNDEWESPLDRLRKEKEVQKQDIEQQINNQLDREGAIDTKGLDKELNQGKTELEKDIDNTLGINQAPDVKRGAIKISPTIYDRDNKTPEEKHDAEVLRRRDIRWEKAADTRPLYRKNSANYDLRKDLNQIFDVDTDNEKIRE